MTLTYHHIKTAAPLSEALNALYLGETLFIDLETTSSKLRNLLACVSEAEQSVAEHTAYLKLLKQLRQLTSAKKADRPYKEALAETSNAQKTLLQEAQSKLDSYQKELKADKSALRCQENQIGLIQLTNTRDNDIYLIDPHVKTNNGLLPEDYFPKLTNNKKLVAHNAKFDFTQLLYHYRLDRHGKDNSCTMIRQALLRCGLWPENKLARRKELSLASTYHYFTGITLDKGKQKGVDWLSDSLDVSELEYAARDVDALRHVYKAQEGPLNELQVLKSMDIEMRALTALVHMEINGVPIDTEGLQTMARVLEEQVLEKELLFYEQLGRTCKMNSSTELPRVLNELGVPVKDLQEASIEAHLHHNYLKTYADVKKLKKQQNTYVRAWLNRAVDYGDHQRLHPNFNQLLTNTHRLSCDEPNLQNVSTGFVIETPEGDLKLRDMVKASPDHYFAVADLSQVEVRIAADITGDRGLRQDIINGVDTHSSATVLCGLAESLETVEKTARKIGKAINLGVIFDKTPFGLAKDLHLDQTEAIKLHAKFLEKRPGIKFYIQQQKKKAVQTGYVTLKCGGKRFLPRLYEHTGRVSEPWTSQTSAGWARRNFGREIAAEVEKELREAVNTPIQGTASKGMKLALWKLQTIINERYYGKMRIILQVHDEVVVEVHNNVPEYEAKSVIKEALIWGTQVLCPSVPILVGDADNNFDAVTCQRWGDAK